MAPPVGIVNAPRLVTLKLRRQHQLQKSRCVSLPHLCLLYVFLAWEKRQKRGSDIIIIHPGTRFLRVGRATDAYPINIPHVIARKTNLSPTPPPSFIRSIPPFKATRTPSVPVSSPESGEPLPDDYAVSADPDDPVRLLYLAKIFKNYSSNDHSSLTKKSVRFDCPFVLECFRMDSPPGKMDPLRQKNTTKMSRSSKSQITKTKITLNGWIQQQKAKPSSAARQGPVFSDMMYT
jgi:hypothetical protein